MTFRLLGTLAALVSAAFGQGLPQPFCVDEITGTKPDSPWPVFSKLRFMEDYQWMLEAEEVPYRDQLDKLKAIRLSASGDFWLSLGGQFRVRAEGYDNLNFNPAADDSLYWLHRYHLHADFRYTNRFRLFTQIRRAEAWDRSLPGGQADSLHDEFDVMNVFFDFYPILNQSHSLMLRAGRFEQTYGNGRTIGCTEWSQLRRPVEGIKLRYIKDSTWVDGFVVWNTLSKKYDWLERNDDEMVWGVYFHREQPLSSMKHAEFYVLGKRIQSRVKPDIERILVGTRFEGKLPVGGLVYDLEFGYQFGDAEVEVAASFLALEIKRSWPKASLKPTAKLVFEYASGDSDPTDGKVKTFEPVAPYGHAFFGYADAIGRQNIVSPSVTLTMQPRKNLTLRFDYHAFWLADSADGLYSPCNCSQTIRQGFKGASSYVGQELDFFAKYDFNHRMQMIAGYSHLFAGTFIEQTGADRDIRRWYAQLQFTF